MTAWNFNLPEAPRGRMETRVLVRIRNGETLESEHDVFVRERVILATDHGEVIPSYWIPGRYTESGALLEGDRWSGLNVDSTPVAWAPWPKHPGLPKAAITPIETIIDDVGSGA